MNGDLINVITSIKRKLDRGVDNLNI